MGFWSKLTIGILVLLAGFYVKATFFDGQKYEKKLVHEEKIVEPAVKTPKQEAPQAQTRKKEYVTVYFLGTDTQSNNLFKTAQREVPEDTAKLNFALQQLIKGPTPYEKKAGVFSEVPRSTKIRGVIESDRIIVDLSSDIVNGGGADSLYSRIKQVIKTTLANAPKKPVYLYIDGKQADVIGGEGLMITQPLKETSLDE